MFDDLRNRWTRPVLRAILGLALFAMGAASATTARAEEHASGGDGADAEAERNDVLDLGAFRLRSSKPTDQEVVDLKFSLTLVLSSDMTKHEFNELKQWKNRLRDQVIVAVRSASGADLGDPQLRRIQRLIMFRLRRLDVAENILGVYVTDFTLDEGQTVEDMLAPPILPSAEPKKADGGE